MLIISGDLKGRNVVLSRKQLSSRDLRPTTNYSKQVLFNLLNNNKIVSRNFAGERILDCFAGTGSIGFEFLSRGAGSVVFVENDSENAKQLKKNIDDLEVAASVVETSCPKITAIEGQEFDLIFIDPPYYEKQKGAVKTVLKLFKKCLADSGVMILEFLSAPKKLEQFLGDLKTKGGEFGFSGENIFCAYKVSSKTTFLFISKFQQPGHEAGEVLENEEEALDLDEEEGEEEDIEQVA